MSRSGAAEAGEFAMQWLRAAVLLSCFALFYSVNVLEGGVVVLQPRWTPWRQSLFGGGGDGGRRVGSGYDQGFDTNGFARRRTMLSAPEAGEQEGRVSRSTAMLQHRHKRRDRCRHQAEGSAPAGEGPAPPWRPPPPPAPGTLLPWDEGRVPPAARDVFLKWRLAEFSFMLHDRHAVKYENQLREKPKLDAAAAKGTLNDEEMGALAWYTAETPEKLQEKMAAAVQARDAANEQRAEFKSELEKLSKELGFALPPSATSPLPEDRPILRSVTVSFLVQFYKHKDSVAELTRRLWECTHGDEGGGQLPGITSELIVNVDSRGDAAIWDEMVAEYNTTSFVSAALSNNLHEVHGYNRIASMARGEILILMQDDQLPPESCTWVRYVVKLFQRHENLGALGLKNGDMFLPATILDSVFKPGNASDADKSRPWEHCREGPKFIDNVHRDPELGLPLDFVTVVDMAPLALRAEAFRDIGMFDEGLADPGECGIMHDWEVSTRMWLNGWQVGLIRRFGADNAFPQSGTGGTHVNRLAESLCWVKQPSLARTDRTSDAVGREIMTAVIEANRGLTLMLDGQPPWVKCCTREKERAQRGEYEACPAVVSNSFPSDWLTRRWTGGGHH